MRAFGTRTDVYEMRRLIRLADHLRSCAETCLKYGDMRGYDGMWDDVHATRRQLKKLIGSTPGLYTSLHAAGVV